MKLVLCIAGDRHYADFVFFSKVVRDELERFPATELVFGDCSGADTMAYDFATSNGIPYTILCASKFNYERLIADDANAVLISDWKTYGKAAGPIRNAAMIRLADRLLLFDGGGPGSRSIRWLAKQKKIEVEVWNITHPQPVTMVHSVASDVQGGSV